MAKEVKFQGKGTIGEQYGTSGSSMALNTQRGQGAHKPSEKGNHNPGNTKPPEVADIYVPINK